MDDELIEIRRKKIAEMSARKKNSVRIYTTSTCYYCNLAKDFLKQNGIEYEEVNLEENPAGIEEMISKSGQMGVPVLDINGRIIVGFNKPAIAAALGI